MKKNILKFLLIFLFGIATAQSKAELLEIKRIDNYSGKIESDKNIRHVKFDVKTNDKTVHYSYQKRGNEIVKIARRWNEKQDNSVSTFTEDFILENGKKIFSYQSETWKIKENSEDQYGWSCRFYIKNNKVFFMPSNGHGKTELDNWDYEKELKENLAFMMKTVKSNEEKQRNN